jgi:putative tryptophan/tyrosine transport system substrate-binding protein
MEKLRKLRNAERSEPPPPRMADGGYDLNYLNYFSWESLMRTQCKNGNPKSKIASLAIVVFAMILPWPNPAAAQQAKIPRVGYVTATGSVDNPGPQIEQFRQGLRDLGYIEGKNVLVEYRYPEGKLNRIPSFVAELVQMKIDVFVLTSLSAIREAKQATNSIPIVMLTTQDPVALGLVASLARPGGNITGLTRLTHELSGKRLELLKEVFAEMSRVAVLWDAGASGIGFKEYEAAAHILKIQVQSLEVRGPNPDLEGAFQAATKARASALSRSGALSSISQSELRSSR